MRHPCRLPLIANYVHFDNFFQKQLSLVGYIFYLIAAWCFIIDCEAREMIRLVAFFPCDSVQEYDQNWQVQAIV